MYGIVTIVEGAEGAQITRAWEELRAKHGPEATRGHNLPHFSYHVADDYDLTALERLLTRLAGTYAAFDVRLAGIGTLGHGSHRIVYLNVVRSPALASLQDALWDAASAASTGVIDHYHRDVWSPHVTLGDHPILLEQFPELARHLGGAPVPDRFRVDNLAVIEEMPYGHEVRLRVSLQAPAPGRTPGD